MRREKKLLLGLLLAPLTEAALVLSRVAGSGAALSGATAVHISVFGMTPVVKFGDEEMRRKYLPPLTEMLIKGSSEITDCLMIGSS